MTEKPYNLSEAQILRQIMDWLKLKRVFFFRCNTGAIKASYHGKQRFIRYGAVGAPDLICCIHGRLVGLEVKAYRGIQSQHQVQFQAELERAGGAYYIVRSVEEAQQAISDPGRQ